MWSRGVGTAIAVMLMLAACTEARPGKQTASNPGAVPPDTSQVPKTPPPPAGGSVATKDNHIQVSNTMNVPMKVSAIVGGQTQALGTVEAKQQASFMLQAPENANIQIFATDSTNQHRVQATLMAFNGQVLHFVIR